MNGTRLYRSPDDRVIAGVAGGMAETYGWDPALVRIAWTLLILFSGGTLLILYIVMALVIPLREPGVPPMWGGMPPAGGGYGPAGAPPSTAAGTGAESGTSAAAAGGLPGEGGPTTGQPAMPPTQWDAWRSRQRRGSADLGGGLIIGALLILVGVFFLAREFIPFFEIGRFWPVLVIGLGLLLLVGAFARRGR